MMIHNVRDFQKDIHFCFLRGVKNKMLDSMVYFMWNKTHELNYNQQQAVLSNYIAMYFSLVMVNWCRRNTLAYAQQLALEQMDSFVRSKTRESNHPMTKYLQILHSQYQYEMSKEIKNNPYAETVLNRSFEDTEALSASASRYFQENKGALSNLYQQLTPKPKLENTFKSAVSKFFKKISFFAWRQELRTQ